MGEADFVCEHCEQEIIEDIPCPHCGQPCANLHHYNATIDMQQQRIAELEEELEQAKAGTQTALTSLSETLPEEIKKLIVDYIGDNRRETPWAVESCGRDPQIVFLEAFAALILKHAKGEK